MNRLQEIKQHYDETYIEDYGDYQTIILEKEDFDWLIEQTEKYQSIKNKMIKQSIEKNHEVLKRLADS